MAETVLLGWGNSGYRGKHYRGAVEGSIAEGAGAYRENN